MSDRYEEQAHPMDDLVRVGFDSLASQALQHVAKTPRALREDVRLGQVNQLVDAMAASNPRMRNELIADLYAAGVTADDMLEDRIPSAARALGQRWREDTLSFADVTIAVSRLQALLRDVSGRDTPVIRATRDLKVPIAMVVPENENHTLGGIIVTNQLRRAGREVRLILGQSVKDAAEEVADYGVGIAMISASVSSRLETVQRLVESIRLHTRGNVPIAIGGSILQHQANVKAITGADVVSTDPREALAECEQKIPSLGAAHSGPQD